MSEIKNPSEALINDFVSRLNSRYFFMKQIMSLDEDLKGCRIDVLEDIISNDLLYSYTHDASYNHQDKYLLGQEEFDGWPRYIEDISKPVTTYVVKDNAVYPLGIACQVWDFQCGDYVVGMLKPTPDTISRELIIRELIDPDYIVVRNRDEKNLKYTIYRK